MAERAVNVNHAQQDIGELTALLSLAHAYQPKMIVEIGTFAGGSAWAWLQLPSARVVYTIDDHPDRLAFSLERMFSGRLVVIVGRSELPTTYHLLESMLGLEGIDLLFVDGDHSAIALRSDLKIYRPLVKPGGLIVIHDTQGYPGHPEIQVPEVWREIRAQRSTLELVSHVGGPYGTGIVFIEPGDRPWLNARSRPLSGPTSTGGGPGAAPSTGYRVKCPGRCGCFSAGARRTSQAGRRRRTVVVRDYLDTAAGLRCPGRRHPLVYLGP